MKNLIIYSGIALVVCVKIYNASFDTKKNVDTLKESTKEVLVAKSLITKFSNAKKLSIPNNSKELKLKTLFLRNFPKSTFNNSIGVDEPIAVDSVNRMNKSAEELIAEDNAITENNISNETQALDFDVINSISNGDEVVEFVNIFKTEKTADELIVEDNAITENNISNETQALDFDVINSISECEEVVEFVNIFKTEKTAEELIAEDNAITENNISNETQALDFDVINKVSKS